MDLIATESSPGRHGHARLTSPRRIR